MTDAPIVPKENEVPPAAEIPPTVAETSAELSKIDTIDSPKAVLDLFERLAKAYEAEGRSDARDEAAIKVLDFLAKVVDKKSAKIDEIIASAPTLVSEVLNRIGLTEGHAEILSPLKSDTGTLRYRLDVVHNFAKQKLRALRSSERETKEREERKADYTERLGELNAVVKKKTISSEVTPPASEKPVVSLKEIPLVERTNTGFEKEGLTKLKKTAALYDRRVKEISEDNYKAFGERSKLNITDPDYSILSKRIDDNLRKISGFKKIKKIVDAAIDRKAGTETEEPEAVAVATAVETSEPVVAADSSTEPEAKAEVVEKIDTKPMLAFLKAFGLPKSEYAGTNKKPSDQLILENFNDYKKVFEHVIGNWKSIPGSLRPPMLIEDSQGNKLPTFAKFAEALIDASPKDREKIKNSYIEFTSVVGGGGAIGSLAGAELSGNSGSSGVNPETFFASHKTTANLGATRRSSVVPGTTSAARPVEAARAVPVAPVAEALLPKVPEEKKKVADRGVLSDKKVERKTETAAEVETTFENLPVGGQLKFAGADDDHSFVVEKTPDGKFKLIEIDGDESKYKGIVDNLSLQKGPDGSFLSLTWKGGEYRKNGGYRRLPTKPAAAGVEAAKPIATAEVSKPAVVAKPEGALPSPKKGKDVEELPEVDVGVPVESSPKASVFEMPVKKTLIEKVYRRLVGKDANFDLNEKETEGIKELEKKGRAIFEELTSTEPLWTEFKVKLEELRTRLGREIEMSDVVFDPSFRKIQKDLVGDKPVLSVPQQIRRLFVLENILNSIGKGLEAYKTGTADKSKAGVLGEDLKDLYDLIQDMSPVTVPKESVDSADEPEVDEKDKVVAAPVETTTNEAKILAEYRKLKGSELQKKSFDLDLEAEKDPDNEELKLKQKVLVQVLGEKYRELVRIFIKDHEGDLISGLEERINFLKAESADLKGKIREARKLSEPVGELKSALTKSLSELDAVQTLFDQRKAESATTSTETSAAPQPPETDKTVPESDSVEAPTDLEKAPINELFSRFSGLAAGKDKDKIKEVLDRRFEDLVAEEKGKRNSATVGELREEVSALQKEELKLISEIADEKLMWLNRTKLVAAQDLLAAKEKAIIPPVVEAPIDLSSSINDLSFRLEKLRIKEAAEPGDEPSQEVTLIQEELNKRYQNIVRTLMETMKELPADRLEEKISRLTKEEKRLVESNKNPERLLKVRAEIEAAKDLLRLLETEEEATSSAAEVSGTPSSEMAPTETAPPAEAPLETETSPVNPVAVSPVRPVEFNEVTGEKSLKDMDASELQKKARELSGEKSKLEARLLTASKNKKPKLQARIDSLNEQLTQVNQQLASR